MKPFRFIPVMTAIVLFLCLFSAQSGQGQKVALVLSGGGSKGAAHIGVIRALEEQQIPIDYIAGTSIGAIIGALYAIGYTPDQMEALLSSEDFARWAAGATDEEYTLYYRKDDPNASWISFDFNFRKKFTSFLPTNLVSAFSLDFEFMNLFAAGSSAAHSNFDSLMIPFRCVVADIDSSKQVTLRSGNLASAVRGSMTLPFIFNPIEIDSQLVFDGGMYNNFPADVAKSDFHPDVLIGSRVAQRYDRPAADDVISQLLTMLMDRQPDTLTGKNAVMIVPQIPAPDLLDFSKTRILADSGYNAALRQIPAIRARVHDSVPPEVMEKKRSRFRSRMHPLVFDSIHITGLTRAQEDYVKSNLKHGRKTITPDELRKEYFLLLDEGYIRRIYPEARYNPATRYYDLYLNIQKTDFYNLQFGGNLSLGTTNEGFIEFRYKYLWKQPIRLFANGYFGRFYNSARVAARIDFNSRTPGFFAMEYTYNHYDYFKNTTYFFDDKTPSYLLQWESTGQVSGGFPVTSKGEFSLVALYSITNSKYYPTNTFSRTDTADQTNFDFFNPRIAFDLNTLNRKQYADAGSRLLMTFSYLNGIEYTLPGSTFPGDHSEQQDYHDWIRFKLVYDNYFESFGPVKLGFYGEGVISNQPLFYNYTSTLLYAPAFQPVPEMQTLFLPNFRATNYAAVGLKAIVRIYKKIQFRAEGYLFQPYQEILQDPATGKAFFGPILGDQSYVASGTFVYHSFLGPISLGVNFYDKLPQPFTVNLNFGFIIFNPRAIY